MARYPEKCENTSPCAKLPTGRTSGAGMCSDKTKHEILTCVLFVTLTLTLVKIMMTIQKREQDVIKRYNSNLSDGIAFKVKHFKGKDILF